MVFARSASSGETIIFFVQEIDLWPDTHRIEVVVMNEVVNAFSVEHSS